MKCNIGQKDKLIRFIIGIAAIVIGAIYSSLWGLLGVIPIFTAFINWCPLYQLFGISTSKGRIKVE